MTTSAAQSLSDLDQAHLWHPWTGHSDVSDGIRIIVRGDGCHVFDEEGNQYIDCKAGAYNASCGYNCRPIIEAITGQLAELMTFDLCAFSNVPAVLLAKQYAALLPPPLSRTLFCSSGSEATEAALKIARMFWSLSGQPEKSLILSARGGYHGTTLAAVAASHSDFIQHGVCPKAEGFIAIETAHQPQPPDRTTHSLEEAIHSFGAENIAALLLEPVQGVGGIRIPSAGYLAHVRQLCSAHDILLIYDEVLTGFGRTGRMFAFEHWEAAPDMIMTSKGVTGGYVPLAAVTTSDRIYRLFEHDSLLHGLRHGHTNSGHATACRGALATIDHIREHGLVKNAAAQGAFALDALRGLSRLSRVRDVRGIGLLVGIEFDSVATARLVARQLALHGVLVSSQGPTLVLSPPLCITSDLMEEVCAAFQTSVAEVACR